MGFLPLAILAPFILKWRSDDVRCYPKQNAKASGVGIDGDPPRPTGPSWSEQVHGTLRNFKQVLVLKCYSFIRR